MRNTGVSIQDHCMHIVLSSPPAQILWVEQAKEEEAKEAKEVLRFELHGSKRSQPLEIMCMHFILSDPHTYMHICNHIHYKKIVTQFSENEGERGGRRPFGFFSENSSNLVAWPFPKYYICHIFADHFQFMIYAKEGSGYQIRWIFGKKIQTAFDPPSFSENYIAFFLWQIWLHMCEEVWWPESIEIQKCLL